MAEFLIYQGPHWMDELRDVDLAERLKNANFKSEYDARYRRGDIVQVFPNGTCIEPSASGTRLCIVKCPELSMRDAQGLDSALEDTTDPEKPILLRRRKNSLDIENLSRDAVTGDALEPVSRIHFDLIKTTRTALEVSG